MSQPDHPSNSCPTSLTSSESPTAYNESEIERDLLAQITSRGEENFERYGGDDIHEPPPKGLTARGPNVLLPEPTLDANMVTWDGPNDPTNPQNWSVKYKWLITVVCTVLTMNVYV